MDIFNMYIHIKIFIYLYIHLYFQTYNIDVRVCHQMYFPRNIDSKYQQLQILQHYAERRWIAVG